MTDPYETASAIKEARKSVRYESKVYCPRDGHLVSGLVVFEGVRYVWLVGGRAGSHKLMMDEWQLNIDDAKADLADMERRGVDPELQEPHRHALAEFERVKTLWDENHWPAWAQGRVIEAPRSEQRGGRVAETPCPGCGRDFTIAWESPGVLMGTPVPAVP